MPKNISTEHIDRMFPFEFYDELTPQLAGYIITNPAFFTHDHIQINENKKREIFAKHREEAGKLNQMNILSVEPIGELLMLDACYTIDQKEAILKGGLQRSQVPISILTVQLYDSSNQPVFASDVTEETIARIPEVLWDEPNLLIAIVSLTEDGPNVGILKAPPHIEQHIERRIFENTDPAEVQNDEK
ncbi:hypothetical protein [Paenibacillus sp. Y412MC10]|uniref:hypothetical protein n=1 Tax=Geobacillus sp. (strain Y412MC10) TaxID=481743 RepID=UPI0011A48F7F|nr:hypothetical protein [Paenibacillus sp. Y412MC10]